MTLGEPTVDALPGLIRVALVDDQRLFTDALSTRLARESDVQVVATVRSAAQLSAVVASAGVDVVLLEVDLAAEDGLALARVLRATLPDLRLVVVSSSQDDQRVLEAVRLGVAAWVPKDGSVEDLLHAVRGAARGESWLPGPLLTRVLRSLSQGQPEPSDSAVLLAGLTAREAEVLQCLVDGMSRGQMAQRLCLSTNTVRTHVQNLLHKLDVHSSLSAVSIARRAGLQVRPDTVRPSPGHAEDVRRLTLGAGSRPVARP